MTTGPAPPCVDCIHFNKHDYSKLSCAAFPDGIPEDILSGDFDHTKKHTDQDNDIIYEPLKEV